MHAPHEQAQHLGHGVLSIACPGFLTVDDIKGDIRAAREARFLRTFHSFSLLAR